MKSPQTKAAVVSFGNATLRVGDDAVFCPINAAPQAAIRTWLFNGLVYTGTMPYYAQLFASMGFNRFSGMRYYKERSLMLWNPLHYYLQQNDSTYREPWITPGNGPDYKVRDFETFRTYEWNNPVAGQDVAMADPSYNIANLAVYHLDSWFDPNTVGNFPASTFGRPLITSVDLPGTTIGNVFKHPIGRSAFFNESGQVAVSQGNLTMQGVYSPPENRSYTMAYQVYITKSGGTGQPILATYTDTGTIAATNQFSDSGYTFTSADVGRKVKVKDATNSVNNNTFFIQAVAGGIATLSTYYVQVNDAGGGKLNVLLPGTTVFSGHTFKDGDQVVITGTTSYNGTYTVVNADQATASFQIVGAYVAAEFGFCGRLLAAESSLTWEMREGSIEGKKSGSTLNSNEVSDNFYQFTTNDINKYIAVWDNSAPTSIGIFLITGVSSGRAQTDASTIHQSFSSGSCYWEVRTGPIAEYFFRRRRYSHGSTWSPNLSPLTGFDLYLTGMTERIQALASTTLHKRPAMRSIHDQQACRWAIFDLGEENTTYAPYGLLRWKELCNEGYDYPYADNDITNMPSGIIHWRDIAVDNVGKLWVTTNDAVDAVGYCVYQIDPAPGGNARYPDCTAKWGKQASMGSLGMPSKNARGVVCDYVAGRVWILFGSDGVQSGGLAYTEDSGATWKIIHKKTVLTGTDSWDLAADNVTVTNPALNANLLAEVVAGEWITFEDGEAGEVKALVASVDSNNQLTLAGSPYIPGPQTGLQMKKGALSAPHADCYFTNTIPTNSDPTTETYVPTPADYDSTGKLYWIPQGRTGVVRFDPNSSDKVSEILNAALGGGYTFSAPHAVTVTKMPNVNGSGVSVFHDNVWVCAGCSVEQYFTRIYNWATPSITRYHRSVGANNWPTAMVVPTGGATLNGPRIIQEPKTGQIYIFWRSSNNGPGSPYYGRIFTDVKPVNTTYFGTCYVGGAIVPVSPDGYWPGWIGSALLSSEFDSLGLATEFVAGYFNSDTIDAVLARNGGMLTCWPWVSYRWGGTSLGWKMAPLNQTWADCDFRNAAGGPHAENVPGDGWLGHGTKRVHDFPMEMECGLLARFDQQGGGTAQADEFVIDENMTFVAALGRIKDNTMTAHYEIDSHSRPTVLRLDEPVRGIGSLWNMVGGWDGGYVDDANDQAWPVPVRGIAEATHYNATGQTNYGVNFSTHLLNNPANPHYAVTLRIHDEYAKASGAVTGLDIFNVTGVGKATANEGAIFTSADVGKTIRIEGAATGGNNTAKVITALDGASPSATVILDSVWSADENDLAWRLRNIPATGYVSYDNYFVNAGYFMPSMVYKLYSSRDGKTWDLVRETKAFNGVAANDPVEKSGATGYIDPGVYFDSHGLNPWSQNWGPADNSASRAIIFDLRALPEHQRRRCFWKVHRENPNAVGGYYAQPATMALFDSSFVPLAPAALMPSDRDDPDYLACRVEPRAILFDSVANATGVANGYGNFTDLLSVSGETIFESSLPVVRFYAGTSIVESTSTNFLIAWVGKKIRCPRAQVTGGSYTGWMTITGQTTGTRITVDRTFSSLATGSITSVTDNGGQAVFNSAGHTLVNGDAVTVTGTTNYNGQYAVVNAVAGVSFEVGAAYVSSQTGTWDKGQVSVPYQVANFGPGDFLRFDDATTVFPYLGRPLTVMSYEIKDVNSGFLQVVSPSIPLAVASHFKIERPFTKFHTPYRDDSWWVNSANFDTGFNAGMDEFYGILAVADGAQFTVGGEDAGSRTAASGADTDGDGWNDTVTISPVVASWKYTGADWLLLYNGSVNATYRKWFKIKSISSGASTVIEVYEDEIPLSENFMWKICRRRDIQTRFVRCQVTLKEPA
jgi:hypothetical protein